MTVVMSESLLHCYYMSGCINKKYSGAHNIVKDRVLFYYPLYYIADAENKYEEKPVIPLCNTDRWKKCYEYEWNEIDMRVIESEVGVTNYTLLKLEAKFLCQVLAGCKYEYEYIQKERNKLLLFERKIFIGSKAVNTGTPRGSLPLEQCFPQEFYNCENTLPTNLNGLSVDMIKNHYLNAKNEVKIKNQTEANTYTKFNQELQEKLLYCYALSGCYDWKYSGAYEMRTWGRRTYENTFAPLLLSGVSGNDRVDFDRNKYPVIPLCNITRKNACENYENGKINLIVMELPEVQVVNVVRRKVTSYCKQMAGCADDVYYESLRQPFPKERVIGNPRTGYNPPQLEYVYERSSMATTMIISEKIVGLVSLMFIVLNLL
eukprot:Pgem_evm1s12910